MHDSTTFITLGALAEGGIEPQPRIDVHEIDQSTLDGFTHALTGTDLYSAVDRFVPTKCVDGRSRADGKNTLGPDAAGGTVSLVVGDALTFDMYCQPGDTASTHTMRVLRYWLDQHQQVGGHDANTAHGGSGCGACDKLEAALRYITDRGDELRSTIAALGVTADDVTHAHVKKNAAQLVAKHYADGGQTIIAAMRETAGKDAVETLTGDHKEVAVVINTQPSTTLNRAKVREQFGDDLQAFNVDVWALKQAADEMYTDASKAASFYYATLCYNVAVAAVLSGPSLRVVVR